MEVIALKGMYHSRKEAVDEAKLCISLTPDVFIVKRPVVTTANTVSGYHYWVCRPIRDAKDWGVDSEGGSIKWIMEFSDDVEVISRRDFAKYDD